MKLIIAEKPSVAESIAKALNKDYKKQYGYIQVNNDLKITWAVGHLFGLKDPQDYDNEKYKKWTLENLPIYFPNWEIKPIQDKIKQINIIEKLLLETKEVINCGDPDDEGQLLIDEILWYFKYKGTVKRLLINDENEDCIKRAYSQIEDNKKYENLGKSAHARRIADKLFGYNMTQFFTLKNGNKGVLNIGRVKTPLLDMIVERDLLIESHKKEKHYKLKFNIEVQKTPNRKDVEEFESHKEKMLKALKNKEKLNSYFDKCEELAEKIKFKTISFDFIPEDGELIYNKELLSMIVELNKNKEVTLAVHKNIVNESAPLPFNLAKLQSFASKKWGYSPDKTLEITQVLREKYKAITYNRSDSQYLNDEHYENRSDLVKSILTNLGLNMDICLDKKPKCFNSEFVTAHHAIIPTMTKQDLEKFKVEEKNIYEIISKYYLIQFLDDCVKEKILIEGIIDNDITKDKIRATQTKTIDYGWKEFLNEKNEEDEEDEKNKVDLSYLEQGLYNAQIFSSEIQELETKPKKRYTYDTLLQDMTSIAKYCEDLEIKKILIEKDSHKEGENGSIGTPATRSSIIKDLLQNGFIEENKKQIISTEKGRNFIKILPKELKKVDMTAKWYLIQEKIKEGKSNVQELVDSTLDLVNDTIKKDFEKVEFKIEKKENKVQNEVLGKCICSGEMVETVKAFTCNKCSKALFKENKFYGKINKTMAKKLLSGKEVVIKGVKGQYGDYDATVKAEFGEKYITLKSIKK